MAAFDYVGALETLTGSTALTNFFVIVIVASFVISMNTATADGSRALYGIARDDMTIKQLYNLNRWNVPGRAMTLDMLVNICFVLFIGNIFGILAASNIGYVLAHFFAITGFILLRKDRPDWTRPIKLSPVWVPVAYVLAAVTAVLCVIGIGWFQTAAGGYGGTTEKLIGFGVADHCGLALLLPADPSRTRSGRTGARMHPRYRTHACRHCSMRRCARSDRVSTSAGKGRLRPPLSFDRQNPS